MNSQDNQQVDIIEEAQPIEESARPLASGIGSRSKVAKPVVAPPAEGPAPVARRAGGIGRGGVSAIVMMVVFLPLVGILTFLLLDANNRVANLQYSLQSFQTNANSPAQADFASLLSQPDLQVSQFKSEDGLPTGRFSLYNAGNHNWAISYGRLAPLDSNQAYGLWLVSKNTSADGLSYTRLAMLPDVRTGGNIRVLQTSDFPAGFQVAAYSELVVTIENLTQLDTKPRGPRRYSLDLTGVH